jgi:small conductance mechanosensitive channel
MSNYLTQLLDQILWAVPNILTALLILLISLYLARLVSRMLKRALERRHAHTGITTLLYQTVQWAIISFGVISALQLFFNVTSFLTGLGIIGFTVGFALQNIMQNFAAGVILLIQRPFNVGDTITTTNYTGNILAIDLRTTEMKTLDGRIVILPNATILANPIENYSRASRRRVELTVSVAYKSTLEQVRKLALEAVQSVTGFTAEPAPMVAFNTIKAASIDLTIQFWIDTKLTNPAAARDAALTAIKSVFEEAKVEIF